MRTILSRWLLSAFLIGWALSHATVLGQDNAGSKADKLRQALDKTITVDYVGPTLNDVLNHLRDKTGLAISLDQAELNSWGVNPDDNGVPIRVKATNEKAGQVLRKVLNKRALSYVILDDELLVTSVEIAAVKQFLFRVSVDVDEVPLKKAMRDFAKNHGVNVVIDPKVSKQAEAPVSLQLDNTSIETTVRLLAELAELKAVRMGSVMFVTSADKAKKIRDEELQQLDNPLNANAVSSGSSLRGGMAFGGAGVPPPVIQVGPVMPVPAPPVPVAPPPVEQKKAESPPR